MPHKHFMPPQLTCGPFTLDEAKRAGLTRWQLEGTAWTRLGPSTYIATGLAGDPMQTITAALRRLPTAAAFSGLTAAFLHGLDVPPCSPIEATVPEGAGISARAGMALRRSTFSKGDIVRVRGVPVTSILRTICEICGRLSLVEAVVIADAALHERRVSLVELTSWAERNAGRRGVQQLRRVVEHAEPAAESPMESRLRMLIVLAGLPRPKAQVSIHNRWGRFVGRPDLYYESERLAIEYDGGVHRNSLSEDNRRQNRLVDAGVTLLRFTAGDVLRAPDSVVAQVRGLLARAGKPASADERALRHFVRGTSAGARASSPPRQG
jgi:very-short-patch-repair endonuclease